MVKQNEKIKLGKKGVNYVTSIVDNNKCNFNGFLQENDVGIDGIIEIFTKSGTPTSCLLAVQIKTGKSYYDDNYCYIPVNNHKVYWSNYSLPVIGIVCIVNDINEVEEAYWVDIKSFLSNNPKTNSIKFERNEKASFNNSSFYYGFCSNFISSSQVSEMTFNEAKELVDNNIQKQLGFYVLASRYSNIIESWKILFSHYENLDDELNLSFFFDSLTYTMPHPDHFLTSNRYQFSKESKKYVLNKVKDFTEKDILRMLELARGGIERGTIGESIEILISHIENYEQKTLNALLKSADEDIIDVGELILAVNNKEFFENHINQFQKLNCTLTKYIIEQYNENDGVWFY
jgi:hypothetical protein